MIKFDKETEARKGLNSRMGQTNREEEMLQKKVSARISPLLVSFVFC